MQTHKKQQKYSEKITQKKNFPRAKKITPFSSNDKTLLPTLATS
jgi:hypothetical protein